MCEKLSSRDKIPKDGEVNHGISHGNKKTQALLQFISDCGHDRIPTAIDPQQPRQLHKSQQMGHQTKVTWIDL